MSENKIQSDSIKTAGWGEAQRLASELGKQAIELMKSGDRARFFQGLRVRDALEGVVRCTQAVLSDEDLVAQQHISLLAHVDEVWLQEQKSLQENIRREERWQELEANAKAATDPAQVDHECDSEVRGGGE